MHVHARPIWNIQKIVLSLECPLQMNPFFQNLMIDVCEDIPLFV